MFFYWGLRTIFRGGNRVVLSVFLPMAECHFFSRNSINFSRVKRYLQKKPLTSFLWALYFLRIRRSNPQPRVSPCCGGRGSFGFSAFSWLIHPLSRRKRCRRPSSASGQHAEARNSDGWREKVGLRVVFFDRVSYCVVFFRVGWSGLVGGGSGWRRYPAQLRLLVTATVRRVCF